MPCSHDASGDLGHNLNLFKSINSWYALLAKKNRDHSAVESFALTKKHKLDNKAKLKKDVMSKKNNSYVIPNAVLPDSRRSIAASLSTIERDNKISMEETFSSNNNLSVSILQPKQLENVANLESKHYTPFAASLNHQLLQPRSTEQPPMVLTVLRDDINSIIMQRNGLSGANNFSNEMVFNAIRAVAK